jgi:hypothetical protein
MKKQHTILLCFVYIYYILICLNCRYNYKELEVQGLQNFNDMLFSKMLRVPGQRFEWTEVRKDDSTHMIINGQTIFNPL